MKMEDLPDVIHKHPPMPEVTLTRDTAVLLCRSMLQGNLNYSKMEEERIRENGERYEGHGGLVREARAFSEKMIPVMDSFLRVTASHYRRDDVVARMQQFEYKGRRLFEYRHPVGEEVPENRLGDVAMSDKAVETPDEGTWVFNAFLHLTLRMMRRPDQGGPPAEKEIEGIRLSDFNVATYEDRIPNTFRALKAPEWIN